MWRSEKLPRSSIQLCSKSIQFENDFNKLVGHYNYCSVLVKIQETDCQVRTKFQRKSYIPDNERVIGRLMY